MANIEWQTVQTYTDILYEHAEGIACCGRVGRRDADDRAGFFSAPVEPARSNDRPRPDMRNARGLGDERRRGDARHEHSGQKCWNTHMTS